MACGVSLQPAKTTGKVGFQLIAQWPGLWMKARQACLLFQLSGFNTGPVSALGITIWKKQRLYGNLVTIRGPGT